MMRKQVMHFSRYRLVRNSVYNGYTWLDIPSTAIQCSFVSSKCITMSSRNFTVFLMPRTQNICLFPHPFTDTCPKWSKLGREVVNNQREPGYHKLFFQIARPGRNCHMFDTRPKAYNKGTLQLHTTINPHTLATKKEVFI